MILTPWTVVLFQFVTAFNLFKDSFMDAVLLVYKQGVFLSQLELKEK